MTYECITHRQNHRLFYEHRLDGQRIIPDDSLLVPNQGGPLTTWQLNELIRHDLFEKSDEPFEMPVQTVQRASPPAFCFVSADLMMLPNSMTLLDQFLDGRPATGYTFRTFSNEIMAHLVHWAGVFDSVSNARKNGWNRPIPSGFNQFLLTKRMIRVAILNRFDRDDDTTD